jgi:hypothetical protein
MISEYIENTFTELEEKVSEMEHDMDSLVTDYLSQFDLNISDNTDLYALANKSDKVFDDAYKTFVTAFLLFLAKKIINGVVMTVADFSHKGIKPVGDEATLAGRMIGYEGGKIVKNGYLDQLGRMGLLRQKFHDAIIKGISTGQKMNQFLRNAKPIFKSGEKESLFASYYRKYAFDSVAQTMNTISLYIADERNLTRYEYKGGLVKNSRPFCVQHAGGIFTREDAKRFDEMEWRGKMPGVPFLVACGGFLCAHIINWLPNED